MKKRTKLCKTCGNGKFNKLKSAIYCRECSLLKYMITNELKSLTKKWSKNHSDLLGRGVIIKINFDLKVMDGVR